MSLNLSQVLVEPTSPVGTAPPMTEDQAYAKSIVAFVFQFLVSVFMMGFCVGMIGSGKGEEVVYLPILTAVIGVWLPNPTFPTSSSSKTTTTTTQQPTTTKTKS